MEYKTKTFIENILRDKLSKEKDTLMSQQKDKDCPMHVYQNTLDNCSNLEYAIKEMEKI